MTIVHEDDAWLLRLQARSMTLYLPPALVGEIVVVENFRLARGAEWRDRLRHDYGCLAARLRFVPADALMPISHASGWWTQQVLKLLASRLVVSARYVVLDAKNHLIRPLHWTFLEAADGRMLSRRYCYREHPLRHFLENTLEFCDLPGEPNLGWFMQADTPFIVDRDDALSAIAFVEAKTRKTFAAGFIDAKITEFFLLAAHLVRGGVLDARYDFSQIACPIVWADMAHSAELLPVIRQAEEYGAPIFAVHRRAIAKLDDGSREMLGRFWQRRGLFDTVRQAVAELVLQT